MKWQGSNSLLKHSTYLPTKWIRSGILVTDCTIVMIPCSSERSTGHIHVAGMNTDTLVTFWLICLVCWFMGSECVFSDWSQEFFLTWEKLLVRFVCVKTFPCYVLKKFPVTSKVVKTKSALRILFFFVMVCFGVVCFWDRRDFGRDGFFVTFTLLLLMLSCSGSVIPFHLWLNDFFFSFCRKPS